MTWLLVAGIAGLAVLDSFNPATLVAVTLILLGPRRRPVAETLGFVAGAFASVLGVGLAALMLLISSARALRPRRRAELALPRWFNPATAIGLGVVMTGADLPNAFPYFIAIERLINAQVSILTGVLTLTGTTSSTACHVWGCWP